MRQLFAALILCAAFVRPLSAQMLIVDRGFSSGAEQSLGLPKEKNAFLADTFDVGVPKEDWVIDRIRVWAAADPNAPAIHGIGDLFQKISLLGGIAPDLPTSGQKSAADCDCHNLPALETASLTVGGNSASTANVAITTQQDGIWQIDFDNLKWSVPGGMDIQFGVYGESRQAGPHDRGFTWFGLGFPDADVQQLRVFSKAGKIQRTFDDEDSARLYVQVWGHLLARVSIDSTGQKLLVILHEEPSIDVSQVDPKSLRFGPGQATPIDVHVEDSANGGKALAASFLRTDTGIGPKAVNACLRGKRADGAPFEGCDLLRH